MPRMIPGVGRRGLPSLLTVWIVFGSAGVLPAHPARGADDGHPAEPAVGADSWHGVLGRPAPDRVYAGLWALHLSRPADGWSQHFLLAVGWRGVVGGTFINSHGDRSWLLGLSREVVTAEAAGFAGSLGYRVGVIRGYDERLTRVAGRWPVVPGMELVGTVRRGRYGVSAGYAGVVASVGGFVER